VRTGSREFLEWIDLDERDFRAIAKVLRRLRWVVLVTVLSLVVLLALVFHADRVFEWLTSSRPQAGG